MPRPGRMTTERAKDFKGTLRQLLQTMSHYKLPLITAIVFAILSTIFNIAGPKVLAKATTALATGWVAKLRGTGSIDFVYIGRVLLFLLGMYLLSSAFSFIQGWLMTGLSQKVCYDFRRRINQKIDRLPLAYFEKRTVGEVLSRITNDVDTLGQSLNQSITQLITSVTTMIGVLIMMLSISPRMTLIAILILPVSLALVLLVVRFSQKYFKAQQATLGVVNGQVEEVYSGHNVVKAFNREAVVLNDFNAANDKLYESAWKSQFLSGLMMPIMNFVGNLGYVAVAIVGSIFAANGTITIGDIQAFIQYVKNFTQPIQQLSQVSNMLQSMAAAAERVFEFLNEPEEDQTADPARRADPACIDGQVTFDHVRFGYTPDKTIIHDFSCTVKPGQKVAIVGPTGAGKTTMVKLLMRFYDVDAGSITLNGHDVRDFDRSALREGFGMVLQDTWLFKGTILENIRYGRLDATDEEVIAAAKAANADHFIRTLPGGYQMELNEDASNVSQGQKQLLTIARTILADNRILILDEATSSVDTRTEQRIQTAMDRLMEGRTSFVIAHRLSTIKDADLILVMRDGDIVEQGTHDQLLAAGGFYMVCIYSFGTILDWHEFVKSPVPALACLKGINMLLYLAMLVIATLGPMGPMNSFYGATSRIMLAMGRKGQLPEKFAEVDPKSGAPKLACVVLGVITVVGPFLGKNMLIPLTNVSALAFIFSCGMVALACLRMRFTEPDLPRPYEVPGGKFGISLAIVACGTIIGLLVIPFSPASLNMVEWSIVIGWLAVGLALMAFTNSRKK